MNTFEMMQSDPAHFVQAAQENNTIAYLDKGKNQNYVFDWVFIH